MWRICVRFRAYSLLGGTRHEIIYPPLSKIAYQRIFKYFDICYCVFKFFDLVSVSSERETEMITTWRTTKTETGFSFTVFQIGYQVPSVTLKTGECSSRAKAMLLAKKWVRYFKAQQRVAA
jgi:hypothetical protein